MERMSGLLVDGSGPSPHNDLSGKIQDWGVLMPKLLSEAQQRRYRRDGLLFPIRVLSPTEAGTYRAACDALEARLGGKPRTIEVRQMHLHFPWAYRLATTPRILDVVEDVLGPDLLIWATELFAKHSHDRSVSIGWHRDCPYMGFEPVRTVTAWIALSDSTKSNGCVCAFPGPDRRTVPPTADAGNPAQIKEVELRAGEMSLHDAEILHGSHPNRSGEKRVGFAIRYVTPQAGPFPTPPPAILVRGRDRHGHFHLVEPPTEGDPTEALAGMKRSAATHLDAMLANLRGASNV
jgi:hypothetical protein